MTDSAFITGIFPYIAVAFFLLGSAWRFVRWLSLPPHLKWTLYPVPEGLAGQLRYMAKEMFTFETLYKFNRRLWFGSFCMHMAMVGAVLFFILYLSGWSTKFVVQVCLSVIAIAAVYIIGLRIYDKNLRLLSNFEEFFNLAFLAGVAAAGLAASVPHVPTSLRLYFLGLAEFRPDVSSLSMIHVLAVFLGGLFLMYLPLSKMIHYVSKYFTYHRINWQKE
jgi:nitrate reductase gamma subunit